MRVVIWALLGMLVLSALPIVVLLFAGLIRRIQIARTRRELERMGFVVRLPYARETRPLWPLLEAGLIGLIALVIATSLLPGTPWGGRTLASTADASPPVAPTHAPVVPPGTNPGAEHSPSEEPATTQGAGITSTSPGSSASPATHAGNDAGAPSAVTALPTSATAIRLQWVPVTGAASYDVERSTDAVTWNVVASGGTQTQYTDVALSSGTTYYYRVAAYVDGQDVSRSDVVSATTTVDTSIAPVLTSATGSAMSVDLAWTDVDGELGYRIERSPDGTSGWTEIGTTGQGVTSYIDTGLAPATTYYYRVIAVTSDLGSSSPSAALSATTDQGGLSTSDAAPSAAPAP